MDAAALTLPFLVGLILVALAFDFLNGMNDAANAIATLVSTRVLRPQYAVAWAAFFNFVAFLFFGLHVAETVGPGIAEAGLDAVVWAGVIKAVVAIFLSPGGGLLLALFLMLAVSWSFIRFT